MSGPRVAFANSTNIPRSSRPSLAPFSKLNSRKSAPTCTVSLANISTNDFPVSLSSLPSASSSFPSQNLIPFPSSSVDAVGSTISQPNRSCLQLLRSSSVAPSQPRTRASSIQNPSQERRKRSTTRLLQPATINASQQRTAPEQPPRKRPRLQKPSPVKTTKPSPIHSSDLKTLAIVQRSVAERVLMRRQTRAGGSSSQAVLFDNQDRLLASRLRIRLIAQGMKETELVDLESELDTDMMDVDRGNHLSTSIDSVDMDIDVEVTVRSDSLLSSSPRRSPPLVPDCVISPPQLVAALILRNHTRKPSRFSASPERTKKPSPLAKSAL
ncbi:hypothetical protein C0993_005486 [Termitomyces sp. T159_Od127]|nr:hypothetical protein C0993_005486 [Termitomyces sp. T159_Od127]